jgi:ribonuclease III
MDKERKKTLREFQKKIGYRFKSLDLLNQGLRHKSFVHENPGEEGKDNERLEFLGDAVLGLVIGHMMMDRYPDYPEGSLSKLRAAVVNEAGLARIARDLSLGDYLLLGKGEEMTRGREKSSIVASSLEALLAAIYLDGGFKKAFKVISQLFSLPLEMAEKESFYQDFKTKLQEMSQDALKATPRYILAKEFGPGHDKIFGVKVSIKGKVAGVGAGKSKKEAEQRAARKTLQKLHLFVEQENG